MISIKKTKKNNSYKSGENIHPLPMAVLRLKMIKNKADSDLDIFSHSLLAMTYTDIGTMSNLSL